MNAPDWITQTLINIREVEQERSQLEQKCFENCVIDIEEMEPRRDRLEMLVQALYGYSKRCLERENNEFIRVASEHLCDAAWVMEAK